MFAKIGPFKYERSGVINALPEKIFPYISNFKVSIQWNPFAQKDPNMKTVFSGADGQVGSLMAFDGNKDAGVGALEMLKMIPNELVEIRLVMTKPLPADNLIQYRLMPEGSGTRFSWSMSGYSGLLGKFVSIFIDCEKMITDEFEIGIKNLKTLVESKNN